jgi:hypothetical protein
LDLLDDDGIAGWHVGVLGLIPLLSDCSDPDTREIHRWLTLDQRREEARWHDPQAALTQALEVLRTRSWGDQRDPVVLDQWLINIDAALRRYPLQHTAPPPFAQRQAARLHTLLAPEPGTEVIRRQLSRLAQAEPAGGETTPHLRSLSLTSRAELHAVARWLEIERPSEAELATPSPASCTAPKLEWASA